MPGMPAATGSWTIAHPEPPGNPPGYSSIYGLSCPSRTFCAAVDESGDAILWNGSRWSTAQPVSHGGTLESVSCTSSTFCATVDDRQAMLFDGTAWATSNAFVPTQGIPIGGHQAVSCASPTFCAAVGSTGTVRTFDGTNWGNDTQLDTGTVSRPVQDISCASPHSCVVVAATGTIATLTGAVWSQQPSPDQFVLHSVSCPTALFCMALDLSGHALIFNGSAWRSTRSIPGLGALSYSVSCATASHCVVARSDGSVLTWKAGTWSAPRPVLDDGTQATVRISCPTTTFCALVDSSGSAATYRG
jgi:hypothetical protein